MKRIEVNIVFFTKQNKTKVGKKDGKNERRRSSLILR